MMNKTEIIRYLLDNNKSGYKTRKKHLSNKYENLIDEIELFNNKYFENTEFEFTQKLYNYLYDIVKIPVCKKCGNTIKWRGVFSEGYSEYCSFKCSSTSDERNNNRKKTVLKKYGVEHITQHIDVKNKIKKTYLEKYGHENIFESEKIKEKTKKTNNIKFGKDHAIQSEAIIEKRKKNNLVKYGVTSPSKLEETKSKMKDTCVNKYGVDSVMKDDNIKKKRIDSNKKTHDTILKYKEFYGENIEITYLGSGNIVVKNQCEIHSQYETNNMLFYNRYKYGIKNPCPICFPKNNNSSYNENQLKEWIENDLGIKTIKHKIDNHEIDIFLPDYNLGIEYNGLYWHSNLYRNNYYHLEKTELCEKNGIQLLHVFEDEWINKQDIVKSIIKSKIGLNDKIFGRKCVVKEVDSKTTTLFLNQNHIQGSVGSNVKLGLFYDNELVSLMTFGKKRISLGDKNGDDGYELLRFCNKLNLGVIGGASKLLNYFIKIYNPSNIITYADRRYSNGELYNKLGFVFEHNTNPNYWYFKSSTINREHRFSYRKDILVKLGFDKNKTEFDIMSERNYLRIYDSGNMKFIYKKNP